MKPSSPQFPPKLLLQALNLHGLGKVEEAKVLYQRLLAAQPRHSEALRLLGTAELQLGHLEAGIVALQKSLDISPKQPETQYNLAVALSNLDRHEEAIVHCDCALALKPSYPEAHYNRGNSLQKLGRYEDAIASYSKAIEIKPNYARAYFNRAIVQKIIGQREAALKSYADALAIDPNYAIALQNMGNLLYDMKRFEEALRCSEKAFAINPEIDFLAGSILNTRGHLANWQQIDDRLAQLVEEVERGKKAASPFELLALVDRPDLHKLSAEIYAKAKHPAGRALPPLSKHDPHDKIRIGYFSTDFGNHPVTHLLAGMFEHHDKSKFEVFAFSFGPDRKGVWRERVVNAVDHFVNVSHKSELEIAQIARHHQIDIAVDLNGYTGDCLPGIFAERAAPVQVGYIGYLGTMGIPCMDYIIADPILVPEQNRQFYSEKIVSLHSYQGNDDKQGVPDRSFKRQDFSLPEKSFIFCSFNNNYKILPATFENWMRILKAVHGSVLWLYTTNRTAIENLKLEAEKNGIDSGRIIFAAEVPYDDHIARHRLADLFLDTHPYNAGATASLALRAGLPILTMLGESFAARMGASLLTAVGLPEMITKSPKEYETLAIHLATHPEQMAAIRKKLNGNLPTCTLFDTERFTRNIEAAYNIMYERSQRGMLPDHIDVSAE